MQWLIHLISHDDIVSFATDQCVILESCSSKNHLAHSLERSIILRMLNETYARGEEGEEENKLSVI